jgi:hypothetical protein
LFGDDFCGVMNENAMRERRKIKVMIANCVIVSNGDLKGDIKVANRRQFG